MILKVRSKTKLFDTKQYGPNVILENKLMGLSKYYYEDL